MKKYMLGACLLFFMTSAGAQNNFPLNGNASINGSPLNAGNLAGWLTLNGTLYSGGVIYGINGLIKAATYIDSDLFLVHQAMEGIGQKFIVNGSVTNPAMVISTSGNVGIGTINPLAKLDVNGQAVITGEGNTMLLKKSNGYPALAFQGINSTSVLESGDNYMKAYVGGEVRFTILSSGNIGIGTINPTEKLSVNGNIKAKEIKVTIQPSEWPDYVFESNYALTPLPELEAFIQQHKHLPGMPKAAEAETNGIALGDMNKKLLEKLEELTLHLIRQQKEIEALKIQLNTH